MNNTWRWKFWRRIPLRAQLFAGFLLPVLLISLSSTVVHYSLKTVLEQSRLAERSVQSIAIRNDLLKAVLDAETGERGFVITGQAEFLQPYHQALEKFSQATTRLAELSPSTTPEIKELETKFQQWLTLVAEPVIAARQQSPGRLAAYSANALYHLNNVRDLLNTHTKAPQPDDLYWEVTEFARLIDEAADWGATTSFATGWAEVQTATARLQLLLVQPASVTATVIEEAVEIAEGLSDLLKELAHEAIEAEDAAVKIVSSGAGKKIIDEIRATVARLVAQEEQHLQQLSEKNQNRMITVGWLSFILPIVSLIMGMLLIFLMQAAILRSIAALRSGAHRIAEGHLETRVDEDRSDELGALARSFNTMASELQAARWEAEALESLQSMLTSSQTEAEAYDSAVRVCRRLLPNINGAFYATAASRNHVEVVQSWGNTAPINALFQPKDCRALRIGRMHRAQLDSVEVFCAHTNANALQATACIPLMSSDESLGVMYLFFTKTDKVNDFSQREVHLALTIADRLSLALSNIRLAARLHSQSIRDPLTGLFNRRYLEETLDRELARAVRHGKPLSVVALDADHFKQFNDEFGHEAGDMVLKKLAEQLHLIVRPSDIACRQGGEEFLLVLPETDTKTALERAEELRQRIAMLDLQYQGRSLGHITVSLGVASIPQHANTADDLLQRADTALYQAKHNGRNRVEVASAAAAAGNLPSDN